MKKFLCMFLTACLLVALLFLGACAPGKNGQGNGADPVSYTHLDVYKRQPVLRAEGNIAAVKENAAAVNVVNSRNAVDQR